MSDPLMFATVLAGGLLMGFAGSLHCAGQCGGIASSLLIATGWGSSGSERVRALLVTQLGRTVTYTIAGGLVGTAGSALGNLLDLAGIQPVLRILGGVMLIWVGLAVVGAVPGPQVFDRRVMAVSGRMLGRNLPSAFRNSSALLLGMAWGAAPCAMVYNALMSAMLTGTPATGALFMLGFGLATVPAVAITALATAQIVAVGPMLPKAALRKVVGIAIMLLGLVSTMAPAMSLGALCVS